MAFKPFTRCRLLYALLHEPLKAIYQLKRYTGTSNILIIKSLRSMWNVFHQVLNGTSCVFPEVALFSYPFYIFISRFFHRHAAALCHIFTHVTRLFSTVDPPKMARRFLSVVFILAAHHPETQQCQRLYTESTKQRRRFLRGKSFFIIFLDRSHNTFKTLSYHSRESSVKFIWMFVYSL